MDDQQDIRSEERFDLFGGTPGYVRFNIQQLRNHADRISQKIKLIGEDDRDLLQVSRYLGMVYRTLDHISKDLQRSSELISSTDEESTRAKIAQLGLCKTTRV